MNTKGNRPKRKVKESNSQRVYSYLLKLLLSKKLVPGDQIDRRTVASELGLSVSPVGEAMLRLESEGLLTTVPRKGTLVGINSKQEAKAASVIREAFECQAVRMCCGEPIKANEKTLIKLAEAVDKAPEGTMTSWKAEMRFHRKIIELAGYPALTKEFEKVIRRAFFCWVNLLLITHKSKPPGHHTELVKKLKSKNPDYAERAMREHLRRGQITLTEHSG